MDQNFRTALLVSPPVALAIDVFALPLTKIGGAEDEDLETLRPGLVASPRSGRHAHRVPLLELDDLVIDLHPPAPAQDHVHLFLLLVRVAVRKAIAGRDALVGQAGFLELERLGPRAELQVRRAVEPRADVLQASLMFLSVNGTAQSYGHTEQDVPCATNLATGRAAPSTQF
jgi:hypothetical protein